MTLDRPKPKEPRKLFFKHIARKIFLEDWAIKLTALIITLGLWLGVTGLSTPTTRRLTVPLNINIASNAQIVNTPQREVAIKISGDKRKIEQLSLSDLSASIDLTDMQPGNSVVLLSPDSVFVPLPQGIKLDEIVPQSIAINLEVVEEREIRVEVTTTGQPAGGFEVYDKPFAVPSSIRVRGPASVVRKLETLKTEPIAIAGKKEGFTARQIAVIAPEAQVAMLNTVIDVMVRIGEKRTERVFTVPVDGLPGKSVSFTLSAPRTALQKAKVEDFKIEMELNENGEEVPRVVLPAELRDLATVRNEKLKP